MWREASDEVWVNMYPPRLLSLNLGDGSPKSCRVSVWKLLLATKPHSSAIPFCWKTVDGTRGEPRVSRRTRSGKQPRVLPA